MPEFNSNVDTYLDAEATLTRMRDMETQSDTIKKIIDSSRDIMEELQTKFTGVSASTLQKEYNEVADTFNEFRNYLQQKIKDMETLTGNITRTDER